MCINTIATYVYIINILPSIQCYALYTIQIMRNYRKPCKSRTKFIKEFRFHGISLLLIICVVVYHHTAIDKFAYDCYLDFHIIFIVFVYNNRYWCIFIRAHLMYMLQMNVLYMNIFAITASNLFQMRSRFTANPQKTALS